MRNSLIRVLLVAVAALLAAPTAAYADFVWVAPTGQGAEIKVTTNGGLDGGPGTPGARTCTYTPNVELNAGLARGTPRGGLARLAGHGTFYDYQCSDGAAGIIYVPDSQAPSAAVYAERLAREAYRYLPLPAPQVRVNPPAGGEQLVNFPTWLWITPASWGVRSATASVPGLSATVTAVPVSVAWTMGDGHRVICHGPGTPYDPTRPEAAQRPSCSYTYRHAADAYPVTATTTWDITWVANGVQANGILPPLARTSPVTPLRVVEVQAINTSR